MKITGVQVVCPLCPLACDDVELTSDDRLHAPGCSIANGFRMPSSRGEIHSKFPNELNRLLRVVTTGTDLVIARGLLDKQSSGQIELHIESNASIEAMLETVSRDGIISATLADVAMHADLIWMIGDIENAYPRLGEKIVARSIVAESLRDSLPDARSRSDRATIDQQRILRNEQTTAERLSEIASDPDKLWQESKYAAVFIGPNAFKSGEEAIASAMLARLVRERNQTSRAVAVTLDFAATLRSVSLWNHNAAPSAILKEPFDIRIGNPLSPDSPTATVQIGGQDPGEELAGVFVSCSVAGVHDRSMMIRGDGAVTLPLAGTNESELKSPIAILNAFVSG